MVVVAVVVVAAVVMSAIAKPTKCKTTPTTNPPAHQDQPALAPRATGPTMDQPGWWRCSSATTNDQPSNARATAHQPVHARFLPQSPVESPVTNQECKLPLVEMAAHSAWQQLLTGRMLPRGIARWHTRCLLPRRCPAHVENSPTRRCTLAGAGARDRRGEPGTRRTVTGGEGGGKCRRHRIKRCGE